ncbi:hypothetical protein DS909_01310 [Phaeobacter gallaeciensis]|uniref:Uncharacterized protein n=2 Tax=Roseobacteraceae TaxID=2854170 RepID=A0A366X9S8_9RHOB|nr:MULTISPECIES: hypothetical protein [Roseobacteraceae]MBT3140545.1 hypothetical protein [Falsiruegeria litorea]MBT8169740.1 hypothetical protein [Falsiruegeria litorea]RBW62271.1 hypothetical protein DS909_01310 [Phaeobacter gallaeciensis]
MVDAANEIRRHIRRAKESVDRASQAKTGGELRDCWEDFLSHFSKAMGKTITAATDDRSERQTELRRFGHRLKNESNKDDPGLTYLRSARNADEHGLQPPAEIKGPRVQIGGFSLAPGASVSGVNMIFQQGGKKPVGPVRVTTAADQLGRLTRDSTVSIPELVKEIPATIRLIPIEPEQGPFKGQQLEPPESLRGRTFRKGDPNDLISAACDALADIINEFEMLSKK